MFYLASPYSHKDPDVVQERVLITGRVCFELNNLGVICFSPILHWHEYATIMNMQTDCDTWKTLNFNWIEKSAGVLVLTLPGWMESKGVRDEVEFALSLGKRVICLQEIQNKSMLKGLGLI